MNLVLDIGNTLQKIAVFNNDECVYCRAFPLITLDLLSSIFAQYEIGNSIISSVAEVDILVEDFLKTHSNRIHFSSKTKLPVRILYKSVDTLGLDRIANAVGAVRLYPKKNILSIQAGTCLVFDFVNESGDYLGGSISSGMKMRFEALHEKTKNLPFLTSTNNLPDILGIDTKTSLFSGVINGLRFEIEGFIAEYQKKYRNLVVLITGGDAEFLQKSIKNTIFAVSTIVLIGLNEIIKYNVE